MEQTDNDLEAIRFKHYSDRYDSKNHFSLITLSLQEVLQCKFQPAKNMFLHEGMFLHHIRVLGRVLFHEITADLGAPHFVLEDSMNARPDVRLTVRRTLPNAQAEDLFRRWSTSEFEQQYAHRLHVFIVGKLECRRITLPGDQLTAQHNNHNDQIVFLDAIDIRMIEDQEPLDLVWTAYHLNREYDAILWQRKRLHQDRLQEQSIHAIKELQAQQPLSSKLAQLAGTTATHNQPADQESDQQIDQLEQSRPISAAAQRVGPMNLYRKQQELLKTNSFLPAHLRPFAQEARLLVDSSAAVEAELLGCTEDQIKKRRRSIHSNQFGNRAKPKYKPKQPKNHGPLQTDREFYQMLMNQTNKSSAATTK